MNKTQEMQNFLEYFPAHFSIFEKDNDIELNTGNTIIDKDILLIGFKEPGKKKIEFLCKHIINNFRVFKGDDYTSFSFVKESNIDSILLDFKEYLKTNKKKSKKTQAKEKNNQIATENINICKNVNNGNENNQKSSNIEERDETSFNSTKTDQNNTVNWSFDWKITIDNKSFIQGNIKSMSDLNNLMEQMKLFFTNNQENSLKETEKSIIENNSVNLTKNDKIKLIKDNTISFEKDFSLELTEDDLNDLFN